jgi:transcriptional regulator with XRE-family HTH domain
MAEFGDRLKMLRAEKSMSAAKFAGIFDKSEGAVRMWELNRAKPDVDVVIAIARYYDCSTDFLLGLSNNRKEVPPEQLSGALSKSEISFDMEDPKIQDILTDKAFGYFVSDLVRVLRHNKGVGEASLYQLFTKILKDGDENVYRVWGDVLPTIWQIVDKSFDLDKLDIYKTGKLDEIVGFLITLTDATHYRNSEIAKLRDK